MLPAAASYPGETYPADQRLRKVSFEDSAGDRYLFWELLGTSKGSYEAHALVRRAPDSMYRHRVACGMQLVGPGSYGAPTRAFLQCEEPAKQLSIRRCDKRKSRCLSKLLGESRRADSNR
jgi:hypothetical protein